MAESNSTNPLSVSSSPFVALYLKQVGAIQEAIFRLSKHPESTPDTEIQVLADMAGELVVKIEEELGIREQEV